MIPPLECVFKHSHLALQNTKELINDLNDEYLTIQDEEQKAKILELQKKLLDFTNELEQLTVVVVEGQNPKANPARISIILENLVNAEYHCIERAEVADSEQKKEELLELGRKYRILRKKLIDLMF